MQEPLPSTPSTLSKSGERGGSVVECRTPEREVRGSKPTPAVLCPWARHFTSRKYWLITQEAIAPSQHDWKNVDWDVKPLYNQPFKKQESRDWQLKIHIRKLNSSLIFQIIFWNGLSVRYKIVIFQFLNAKIGYFPWLFFLKFVFFWCHQNNYVGNYNCNHFFFFSKKAREEIENCVLFQNVMKGSPSDLDSHLSFVHVSWKHFFQ